MSFIPTFQIPNDTFSWVKIADLISVVPAKDSLSPQSRLDPEQIEFLKKLASSDLSQTPAFSIREFTQESFIFDPGQDLSNASLQGSAGLDGKKGQIMLLKAADMAIAGTVHLDEVHRNYNSRLERFLVSRKNLCTLDVATCSGSFEKNSYLISYLINHPKETN